MRITSLEVFRYRIPLVTSLNLAGTDHHFREGLIIRILGDKGYDGLAEIAPLSGWHQETLNDALIQVTDRIPKILKKIKWEQGLNLYETCIGSDIFISGFPSVRWGLELALLQLISNRNECQLYETLGNSVQDIIKVNALLVGERNRILEDAENRIKRGYKTLKVKVGRFDIQREIKLIRELRNTVGSEINIRLDANQSWSIKDAVHFGTSVKDVGIEYVEEPIKNTEQLNVFFQETGIPVALDESLYYFDSDSLASLSGFQYLILKPSRLGGIKRFLNLIKLAGNKQFKVVLSSTFESGLTIAVLTQLAGLIQPGALAMGLDTLRWLKEDLLKKNIVIRQGKLMVSEVVGLSQDIDWDKLTLIKKFDF